MDFSSGKSILIISPEFWGSNYVSKHHYSKLLSERGNSVYFLNPPSAKNGIRRTENRHFVIDYKTTLKGLNYMPKGIRNFFALRDINRIKKILNSEIDIVWSFDPFRFHDLQQFEANVSIYHAVDIHHTKMENYIADSADLVLGTSNEILRRIATISPKYKINHGLAEDFAKYKFTSNILNYPIKIGYVGNLHYKYLDAETLKKIIADNESIEFHFIGPYNSSNLSKKTGNRDLIKFLANKKNCFLYGSIPPMDLPKILNKFNAFFMCYTGDKNKAELANPHKILEYLSTGKVVVSHYIDEYKNKTHLIEMVISNLELPEKFKTVISNLNHYNNQEKQKLRKSYALNNTYKKKIQQIEQLINENL